MLRSSSPQDFWGRRWNVLVHSGLKNGVYKPLRFNFSLSPFLSVIGTFIASGMLHEYINVILFSSSSSSSFKLKNILFFGWNGFLIISQFLTENWRIMKWLNKNLPPFVKTVLVILTALPLGHLFTGDWVKAGYFDHINLCLPSIVRIAED